MSEPQQASAQPVRSVFRLVLQAGGSKEVFILGQQAGAAATSMQHAPSVLHSIG
jgi:hypothetical protein